MKYRDEIDGLRALAVLPVILFHAGFQLFSGGYVGVDVFFVISGYLITTILIEDIENNRFSIVSFYERRARRILPALFFVMLVCVPFAWMWMLPSQIRDFSQSIVAVALFASNILFWQESGYFDLAAEEKPLLHTWSLAVEEQYYVLFPIFLFLFWRFGKNKVFWMIVVMAAISLTLSEWGWRKSPSANFYLAPTRAWELLAGAISAFVVQKHGVQTNNVLSLTGLAAIIFSIFAFDQNTPFPSLYAMVPVVGTVLLVLFASKETISAKLLRTKAFVGVGLISYSAYLWHQPLFAYARIYTLNQVGLLETATLLVLTLVFAYFTYRFIEQPFRKRNVFKAKMIFISSVSGLVLFLASGFSLMKFYDVLVTTSETRNLLTASEDWSHPGNLHKMKIQGAYVFDVNKPVDVLVFGDSHAEQYAPLADNFSQNNLNMAFLTGGGCPPIPNVLDDMHPHCFSLFDKLEMFLQQNSEVRHIIVGGCFNCYFLGETKPREASDSNFDYYYFDGESRHYYRDGKGTQESFISLSNFLTKLSIDYNVLLLGDNPEGVEFDPTVILQSQKANSEYFIQKYGDYQRGYFPIASSQLKLNQQIKALTPERGSFLNVAEAVCPNNNCFALGENAKPIYKDNNHMRPWYVNLIFHDLPKNLQ